MSGTVASCRGDSIVGGTEVVKNLRFFGPRSNLPPKKKLSPKKIGTDKTNFDDDALSEDIDRYEHLVSSRESRGSSANEGS